MEVVPDFDMLMPCPFCGAGGTIWQDYARTWGIIEHRPGCWLACGIPGNKQEIPATEIAAWNRRAER